MASGERDRNNIPDPSLSQLNSDNIKRKCDQHLISTIGGQFAGDFNPLEGEENISLLSTK